MNAHQRRKSQRAGMYTNRQWVLDTLEKARNEAIAGGKPTDIDSLLRRLAPLDHRQIQIIVNWWEENSISLGDALTFYLMMGVRSKRTRTSSDDWGKYVPVTSVL